MLIITTALSGCVSLDRGAVGSYGVDQLSTSSIVATDAQANLNQALPTALPDAVNRVQLASSNYGQPKYLPPASIGNIIVTQNATLVGTTPNVVSDIVSKNLPSLTPTTTLGSKINMPAQQATIQTTPAPVVANLVKSTPSVEKAYVHIVQSGESLYSIARSYNVSVNSIVAANSMLSADKIGVGQKIAIPGREDLIAKQVQAKVASIAPIVAKKPTAISAPVVAKVASVVAPAAQVVEKPKIVAAVTAPVVTAPVVTAPVKASIPETFRWPVSGKLITDFAASKGTGINISAAKGSPVRSSATGTVIYVGNAVEGYGNLILVKHDNGYVSAYAHLDSASVTKGSVVKRGDIIGSVGQSGSVNSSQLHFEIRKGATPIDPVPMLAS